MMRCCPCVSLVDVFIVLVLQLANQLFLQHYIIMTKSPSSHSALKLLYIYYYVSHHREALSDTAIRLSVCPTAQLPQAIGMLAACRA